MKAALNTLQTRKEATAPTNSGPTPEAEGTILRLEREALRAEPPALRFVARDLRLPQL
jgi:hypothetical protein